MLIDEEEEEDGCIRNLDKYILYVNYGRSPITYLG